MLTENNVWLEGQSSSYTNNQNLYVSTCLSSNRKLCHDNLCKVEFNSSRKYRCKRKTHLYIFPETFKSQTRTAVFQQNKTKQNKTIMCSSVGQIF